MREIRNYDANVRSDVSVRDVDDLKVVENLRSSLVDGFIRNNNVGVRSDVDVRDVFEMNVIGDFNECRLLGCQYTGLRRLQR